MPPAVVATQPYSPAPQTPAGPRTSGTGTVRYTSTLAPAKAPTPSVVSRTHPTPTCGEDPVQIPLPRGSGAPRTATASSPKGRRTGLTTLFRETTARSKSSTAKTKKGQHSLLSGWRSSYRRPSRTMNLGLGDHPEPLELGQQKN